MYIKNSYITFSYRIFFLVICGFSICTHFTFHDMDQNTRMISYFTIQSAIFCFIVFSLLAYSSYCEIKHNNIPFFRYSYISLKGMATLAIIITFLSYQFVLRELGFSMNNFTCYIDTFRDVLAHYVIPILVIFDWLLFQPKGLYRWFDTLTWLLFPAVYFIVISIRGVLVHRYPYFFLNVDEIGLSNVIIYVCIYITIVLFIGFGFFIIDKMLSKITLPPRKV